MPAAIAQLSALTRLSLASNALVGSLPAALAGLATLRDIDVSSNALSGAIDPAFCSKLSGFVCTGNTGLCGLAACFGTQCGASAASPCPQPPPPPPSPAPPPPPSPPPLASDPAAAVVRFVAVFDADFAGLYGTVQKQDAFRAAYVAAVQNAARDLVVSIDFVRPGSVLVGTTAAFPPAVSGNVAGYSCATVRGNAPGALTGRLPPSFPLRHVVRFCCSSRAP